MPTSRRTRVGPVGRASPSISSSTMKRVASVISHECVGTRPAALSGIRAGKACRRESGGRYAVGMALERNPQAAERMACQGCDFVDHGWRKAQKSWNECKSFQLYFSERFSKSLI